MKFYFFFLLIREQLALREKPIRWQPEDVKFSFRISNWNSGKLFVSQDYGTGFFVYGSGKFDKYNKLNS